MSVCIAARESYERQSPLEKNRACLGVENTCGMNGGRCRGVDLENSGAVLQTCFASACVGVRHVHVHAACVE